MVKKTISMLTAFVCMTMPLSASVAVAEDVDNIFTVNYTCTDDILTSTLKIDGNVCLGGFEGVLNYDPAKYEVQSKKSLNTNVLMNVLPAKGEIVISMAASSENLTVSSDLLMVSFKCLDALDKDDFSFEISDAYRFDEHLDSVEALYTIQGNWNGSSSNVEDTTPSETTSTTTFSETVATTFSTTNTSLTTTPTETTTASVTTESYSPTQKNVFVISKKENEQTKTVDVSFAVNAPVEFWTAEGSIKITSTGLGEPKELECIGDALTSFEKQTNSILFTIVSASGENITEPQTIFVYSFPIENADYAISCKGEIRDICNQNYEDEEYMIYDDSQTSVNTDTIIATTTQPTTTTTSATTTTTTQPTTTTSTTTTTTTQPTTTTTLPTTTTTSATTTTTQPTTTTTSATTTTTQPTTTTTSATTPTVIVTETEPLKPFASNKELCDMSITDYQMRTGNIPANAELTSNEDGSVLITLTNEDGDVLDTYVIDPITGKGTTVNGDAIDLPQTGNNAFGTAAGFAAAISMTIAGAFVMLKSGKLKKKEFED